MLARFKYAIVVAFGCSLASTAVAQDPYVLRTTVGSEAYLWELRSKQAAARRQATPAPNSAAPARRQGVYTPRTQPAMSNQAQNAMRFWSSRSAQATYHQAPARPSFVQPASATVPATADAKAAKPFGNENAYDTPTVSPYLQLFRQDFEEEASNYHAFVRPALETQRERQRRRRQDPLQPAPRARQVTAGTPTSGTHVSRFGNTGSFYSGWQR